MTRVHLRARRGSALILVLLMTLAVAALAVAAIFMSSSANLLSRFYDRERQFYYAAESGIQRVVSRLAADTAFRITATTPDAPVLDLVELTDASGTAMSGVRVRVWAARTFNTTTSGPVTISLLAQVVDASGTRLLRRTDVRQESFGVFTLATNTSTGSSILGSNIPFASGAHIPGRIHVNGDWANVGGNPDYRDSVFATGTISDNSNLFRSGDFEGAARLAWPSADSVRVADSAAARTQSRYIDVSASYPTRLEFFVRDDDMSGTIDADEGYLRVYELRNGDTERLRAAFDDDQNATNDYYAWDRPFIQNQCGAFYLRNGRWRFFPVATHRATWAWAIIDSAAGIPSPPTHSSWNTDNNRRDATRAILQQPTARCFPAGSPYLLNTESFTNGGGQPSTNQAHRYPFGVRNGVHIGGLDSLITRYTRTCTFDWNGAQECTGNTAELGEWRQFNASFEIPLDRGAGAVVYVDRSVYVHGTIAGRVKLHVNGTATLIDRIVHAGGPNDSGSDCGHLFGLVARDDIVIDDNSVSARRRVGSGTNMGAPGAAGSNATWIVPGGAEEFALHGAYFALTGTIRAAGWNRRTDNANSQFRCQGAQHSGGCLALSGSFAAEETSRFSAPAGIFFGSANGNGFRWTPAIDACLDRGYRPPLFPLTNRYRVLRSENVRPAAVLGVTGIADYFARLQGSSDVP